MAVQAGQRASLESARVTPPRRLAKPLVLLFAGAAIAGCGTKSLEGASLETKIEAALPEGDQAPGAGHAGLPHDGGQDARGCANHPAGRPGQRPLPVQAAPQLTPRALIAGASLALAVAGCGEGDLDGAKLSNQIEASLKKQQNVVKVEVKCPPKIEREVGGKFSCPVVTDKEADDAGQLPFLLEQVEWESRASRPTAPMMGNPATRW